ncbi:alginate lyase family protein [Trinickia symbiotica]|nr:alginate lyase family protein [Trinickia symbiotica]
MKTTAEYLDAVKAKLDIPSDYATAKALGVTRAAVSGYRNGRTVPDDLVCARIASILDIEPMEVIAATNYHRAKTEDARALWEGIWGKAAGAIALTLTVFAVGLSVAPTSKAAESGNGMVQCRNLDYVKSHLCSGAADIQRCARHSGRHLLSFAVNVPLEVRMLPKPVRMLLAPVLAAIAVLVTAPSVRACDIPAAVQTIDPPGYYDDASGYAEAVKPMRNFVSRLNTAAGKGDWSCALTLLDSWAQSDALMGHISGYQGYYERSWAGTDFAMVILHMPRGFRDENRARFAAIDPWLERIAIATRDAEAINHLHNNLVYWAGLNLIAIGTVTGNSSLFDSGLLRIREGIRDIEPDGALAREVKRGNRALHYHTFALIPLVFAAELARSRNIDLYRENDGAIGRLANLVIEAVDDPQSFTTITPIKQDLFPWTFRDELCWVEPYYARFRDSRLPALIAPRRPFDEWRLGGNVTAFWGAPLP